MATTDRRGLEALERQLLGTVIEPARSVWTPQLAAAAKWVADVAPDRLAARSTALLQALAAYDPSGADQAARAQAIDQAARALANELGTSVEGLVGAKSYKQDSEKQTIDGARTLLDAAAIALTSWSGAFARFEAADEGQGSGTEVGPLYLRNATTRDPVADPYVLDAALTARAETGYFVLQVGLDMLAADERHGLDTDHTPSGTELGDDEEAALVTRLDRALAELATELQRGDPEFAVLAPIPTHGWLLRSNKSLAQLAKLRHVRFVDIFQPAFKLTDTLRERVAKGALDGTLGLRLLLFAGESPDAVVAEIKARGGVARVVDHLGFEQGRKIVQKVVGAVVPAAALPAMAGLRQVYLIDEDAMPGAELDVAHGRTGVTTARATLGMLTVTPLDGAGQVIGIYDSGVDNGTDHGALLVTDLALRVAGDVANWVGPAPASWADRWYNGFGPPPVAGHGTQVAGIALGNGALSGGALVGVAPAATAVIRPWSADFQVGWPLAPMTFDINRALTNAYAAHACIHNDSWGETHGPNLGNLTFFRNAYRHSDRQIDMFTHATPDMLVVTSAGNEGNHGASSITSPGTGKNVLTVGASGNGNPANGNPAVAGGLPNVIAPFSSRGPAPAHRLKPEVVVPGNKLASIRAQGIPPAPATDYVGHNAYKYGGGTSFAAPYVSGAAALVRQFLADGTFHGANHNIGIRANPSGMLLRALLVNGAAPVGVAHVPNHDEGWGLINLDRSLDPAHLLLVYDSIDPTDPHNGGHAFMLRRNGVTRRDFAIVAVAGQPLSITLAYNDRTDGGAVGALVYDLDLVVREAATGDIFRGGVPGFVAGQSQRLHTGPQKANAALRDRFNTIEKVYIPNPVAGNYTIRVKRRTIPWTWPNQPPEEVPFALVVRQD